MDRAQWWIGLKPRMLNDVVKFDSFGRISLQKLLDQVFCHSVEPCWPLDLMIEDVVEEHLLVCAFEGRTPSQQFKE
jgi:hypothetical protein